MWRKGRFEREEGIWPEIRLEEMETRRRRERLRKKSGGIWPVIRPGKMTSSVKEVRLEIEEGRMPPRPGESVRPVPRVRTETLRRFVFSSSREQVMPEKVEQGSERKFQEEKKVEPGRSKRLRRMFSRASRSKGERDGREEEGIVKRRRKKMKRVMSIVLDDN